MARIKLNVSRLSSSALVLQGRSIVSMMTGNPVYPALQADLLPLAEACDALEQANLDVQFNGGKLAFAHKEVCTAQLGALITAMVPKVTIASGGDAGKILGAGFNIRKEPGAPQLPHAPQGLGSVRTGREGTVTLRWRPQPNVRFHQVEWMAEDGSWSLAGVTSRCSFILSGLEPGRMFSFRVSAHSARGAGPTTLLLGVRAAA